jgi:hypothetical protein
MGSTQTVERALAIVRKHLDMDVAYLAEFTGGQEVYRALEGDAESFGLARGDGGLQPSSAPPAAGFSRTITTQSRSRSRLPVSSHEASQVRANLQAMRGSLSIKMPK